MRKAAKHIREKSTWVILGQRTNKWVLNFVSVSSKLKNEDWLGVIIVSGGR